MNLLLHLLLLITLFVISSWSIVWNLIINLLRLAKPINLVIITSSSTLVKLSHCLFKVWIGFIQGLVLF